MRTKAGIVELVVVVSGRIMRAETGKEARPTEE